MARNTEGSWYWSARDGWYATVGGRSIPLRVKGKANRPLAVNAWHKLMAGNSTDSTAATTGTTGASDSTKPMTTNNPDEMTVGAAVDAFLAEAATRLKATTVTMYGVYLARLKSSCGGKRVSELLPVDVHKWMLKMGKCGTTHGIALRSASACLGWAVRNDIMTSNPARKVPKPKSKSRSADAVITEADHRKLLDAADPEFLIFLPPDVSEMLEGQAARYASGALLRSNKGFAWTGRSVTEAMRRLHKKAGVRCIAYGYRHGFATTALSRGIPDAQVAARLGHTSTAVLHAHYSHLTSQAGVLREALDKMRP